MNLGEAKKKALSLMDEYSVDGVMISDGENADYLNRMNRFANDAQMEISDKIGIESSYIITQSGTSDRGFNKYDLPDDFKQHRFINLNDYRLLDFRMENRKLLLNKQLDGTIEHFYYKNPQELSSDTLDSYVFEVDLHAQHLIPYFMGGMSLQDENSAISDRLLNMYYSKLSSLNKNEDDYPNMVYPVYTL